MPRNQYSYNWNEQTEFQNLVFRKRRKGDAKRCNSKGFSLTKHNMPKTYFTIAPHRLIEFV